MKTALITGVTGQDGAYLARFLLEKGYQVHGVKRRTSLFNTARVDSIYEDPHLPGRHFSLHYGDLTDASSLIDLVRRVQPDEIYNLGARRMEGALFFVPAITSNAMPTASSMRTFSRSLCAEIHSSCFGHPRQTQTMSAAESLIC